MAKCAEMKNVLQVIFVYCIIIIITVIIINNITAIICIIIIITIKIVGGINKYDTDYECSCGKFLTVTFVGQFQLRYQILQTL